MPTWAYPLILLLGGTGAGVGAGIRIQGADGENLVTVGGSTPEREVPLTCEELVDQEQEAKQDLIRDREKLQGLEEDYERMVVRLASCLLVLPDRAHPKSGE
jgi:hypothetical protein